VSNEESDQIVPTVPSSVLALLRHSHLRNMSLCVRRKTAVGGVFLCAGEPTNQSGGEGEEEGKENTTEDSHVLSVLFAPGTLPFRPRPFRPSSSVCLWLLLCLFHCPSDCSGIAPWRTIWSLLSAAADSLRSAFHHTLNC
jgi:hypothetical protein